MCYLCAKSIYDTFEVEQVVARVMGVDVEQLSELPQVEYARLHPGVEVSGWVREMAENRYKSALAREYCRLYSAIHYHRQDLIPLREALHGIRNLLWRI